jgi:hypothetical protein
LNKSTRINKGFPQWQALETAHMIRTFPLSQQLAVLALSLPQATKERRRYKQ